VGYQLIAAALQPHWARLLTPRETLTLVCMCQAALDEPRDGMPAGYFFAGTDYLILRIEGDDFRADPRRHEAARKAVSRALRRLEEVGAIRQLRKAKNARRAEYLLTVWQGLLPGDNSVPDSPADLGIPPPRGTWVSR